VETALVVHDPFPYFTEDLSFFFLLRISASMSHLTLHLHELVKGDTSRMFSFSVQVVATRAKLKNSPKVCVSARGRSWL
jgi:hypothetical protein